MNIPKWLKPGLQGAAVGAVALAIVGFSWGGWVTGGTAKQMAEDQAKLEVVAALVPICIEQSKRDPQIAAMMNELGSLRQGFQQIVQTAEDKEKAALNASIDAFAAQPGTEYFPDVRQAMGGLLPIVISQMPNGSQAEWLKECYNRACQADPAVRAAITANQTATDDAKRTTETAKKTAAAKKAAEANVSTSGTPPGQPVGNTIRETLERVHDEITAA